jgi:hypothetical protein
MLHKFVLFVGIFLVASTGSVLAAGKIGSVVAVVGSPSASGPGGNRTLKKNGDVFEDDTIKVSSGNAQIILDDGTRIVVGPNSSLLLDQFVRSGKTKAEKVALKGLRGTYRFITGRSAKSAYRITTAHGTIGIRGTAFDVWSRAKTGAVVLRGRISLKANRGNSIDVRSGCQMGEASTSNAKPLRGIDKNNAIKENLPFILDQSTLTRRFRLDVITCRLNQPEDENSRDKPEPQQNNERRQ